MLNLVLERDLPQDELLYANMGVIGVKGLIIPENPASSSVNPLLNGAR